MREMQIKSAMHYYLTAQRLAFIKKNTTTGVWGPFAAGLDVDSASLSVKTIWTSPKYLGIELLFDPATILLGINLKRQKQNCRRDLNLLFLVTITTIN